MNPALEQALLQMGRAKAVYLHALKGVDATLAAVVSRDPSLLEEARDIQLAYIEDIRPRELAAAEHPAAPVTESSDYELVEEWKPVVYRNRVDGKFYFCHLDNGEFLGTGADTPAAAFDEFKNFTAFADKKPKAKKKK